MKFIKSHGLGNDYIVIDGKNLKKNPQGIYFDIYNDGSVDKLIKFNNYKD